MSEETIEVIKVGPDLAAELLDGNVANRPLSMVRVDNLAAAMLRGEWKFNGDAIRIAASGRLLDGQHRLNAIVKSGVEIECILVRGLPDDTFDTIDTGRPRKASDILSIAGLKNSTVSAAAAKMWLLYKVTGDPMHSNPRNAPTYAQILEFCREDKGLARSIAQVNGRNAIRRLLSTQAIFCHMAFSEWDKGAADAFFDELAKPPGETPYKIVAMLREQLIEGLNAKSRFTPRFKIYLTFKAFRHFCEGADIRFLRVHTEGKNVEAQPLKMPRRLAITVPGKERHHG